jgi:transcription elongation factor GreA-like protein/transcription elongation GreA/GreB family factor
MAYVEEFQSRLAARDYNKILVLWQEYCENDELDVDELVKILQLVKQSDLARPFGQYVEAILPLVMTISDESLRLEALRYIYDLETSNSQALFDLAHEILKKIFGHDSQYQEKLRLIGLRTKGDFQGALSNFILLNHIARDNFVFHNAGWGVGKITDASFLREQVTVEFENLGGCKRDISFKNAFHSLVPLSKDHFLVARFEAPDELERQANDDHVGCIVRLLQDLGPKTASEIKELMIDLVIPADQYSKWWQSVRSKLKKNPHIESPKTAKDPFVLRKAKISEDERLGKMLDGKETFQEILGALYAIDRDFPEILKDKETKNEVLERAKGLLHFEDTKSIDHLQVYFLLEQILDRNEHGEEVRKIITSLEDFGEALGQIEIVAMRKRFLQAIRELRADWEAIFADLMLIAEPVQLKDYILKELNALSPHTKLLAYLQRMVQEPALYPEAFLWYFQKVVSDEAPLLDTQADKEHFFESFLILLSTIEMRRECRDIVKKMHALFTGQRFKIVRTLLKDTDSAYAREFLLLASKCQSLGPHDQNILHSLVEVVHGGPSSGEREQTWDQSVIWTTEEGYQAAKGRIQHIGIVEVVENAREIEEARAHGDFRENAEYKAALERRSQLQHELKSLSDQFNRARIISTEDISTNVVGVGTKISLKSPNGNVVVFTILGPWDANPDKNILSINSKLAQALLGKKVGNHLEFRGETVSIHKIESYL